MGKKKREKFAKTVRTLAHEQGYRVGFLVIEDGDCVTAFTSYKSSEDAKGGITVLRDILLDLTEGGDEE